MKNKITPDEFLAKLKAIKTEYFFEKDDLETCHAKMDEVLCEILSSLGYDEGIRFFQNTPKWYA